MTIAVELSSEEQAHYLALAEQFEKNKHKLSKSKMAYPEFDINALAMTDHAYDMAYERFGIKSRKGALKAFRQFMERATYICETVDESGNRSHTFGVFVRRGVAARIHVRMDMEVILTVIKVGVASHPMPKQMKDKVMSMYRTEIKKLTRLEKRFMKKNDNEEEIHEVQEKIRQLANSMISSL